MSRQSKNPCLEAFEAALQGRFDKDDIDTFFKAMEGEIDGTPDDRVSQLRERLNDFAERVVEDRALSDDQRKFSFIEKMKQQKIVLDRAIALRDSRSFFTKKLNGMFLTILAIFNGIKRGVPGSKNSLWLTTQVQKKILLGNLYNEIKRADLLPQFNAKLNEADPDLAKAILAARIEDPIERAATLEGLDSKTATLGEIISTSLRESEKLLNEHGIFFRDLTDRITTNFHDKTKMLQSSPNFSERRNDRKTLTAEQYEEKAFQHWRGITQPLLKDSVFHGLTTDAEREVFMREGYNNITDDKSRFHDGRKSIQSQVTERRIFNWRSPEAFSEYNAEFGAGNLHDALIRELEITAQRVAQLSRVGENPDQFIADIERIIRANPKKFGEQTLSAQQAFTIRVTKDVALNRLGDGDSSIARVGRAIRASKRMAQLGKVVLSALPDIALMTLATRRMYGGWFKATGALMSTFFDRKSARQIGFMNDFLTTYVDMERGHLGRMGADGVQTGDLANIERLFFKLSGIEWWDRGWRETLSLMASRHLWTLRDVSFGEFAARDGKFGEENVRILQQYGIDGTDWDAIRKNAVKLDNQKSYLVPEAALKIDRDTMVDVLRKQGRKGPITDNDIEIERRKIRDKFANYIHDVMDSGIIRPDAQVQGILALGLPQGTIWGEVLRISTMYKSWAMMWTKQGFGELLYGRGANSFGDAMLRGKGDVMGMLQLFIYGGGLGYMTLMMKSFANGLTPPDPTKPRVIIESLLAGGAPLAGMGSLIMQNAPGFNRGMGSAFSLLGPLTRDANDLFRGTFGGDPLGAAVSLIKGNAWGGNLPAVSLGLQYGLYNTLQNYAHPGSVERHKRLLLQETGQRPVGG